MIWCVEDDASIRDIEVYALTSTGFEARGFEDGTSFWDALQRSQPELVVLDVMLPGIDGVELLKRMKASEELQNIPVIMATAKGTEYDKIQSLDLGADDYLVKPFGIMEMVSRVKAVLRRCKRTQPGKLLSIDGLVLNPSEHTVSVDGQRVILTYKEYALLHLFLSQPGIAFTREQLLASIWNTEYLICHALPPDDNPHCGQFLSDVRMFPVSAAGCGYAYPPSGFLLHILCSIRRRAAALL